MQSEFEFISRLKEKFGLGRVGDDCAVLPSNAETDLVVTADVLVENVDFRLDWTLPEWLGHKALAVSLSDVAAMGAEPLWAMISIAIPPNLWDEGFLERFYNGWSGLATEFGVELIGGDISRIDGPLVIDSIAGGSVGRGKAVLRSGARPGDSIYVSGSLGGAAGGLKLLEDGHRPTEDLPLPVTRQLQPQPQVALGKSLGQQRLATAMIDISDGFSSDIAHLCEAGGVGAQVSAAALPIDSDLSRYFAPDECLELALNGGEDFELLFTSGKHDLEALPGHRITRVGQITSTTGHVEIVRDGHTVPLEPRGYQHF